MNESKKKQKSEKQSLYKTFSSIKAMKDLILPRESLEYLSTGVVTLNLAFSGQVRGGITKGKISLFAAPSQSAKTSTALGALKNAQKSGMECVVLDCEHRFDYDWADSLGIKTDPENLLVLESSYLPDICRAVQEMIEGRNRKEKANIYLLLDSWATLVSPTVIEKAEKGSDTKNMSEAVWKNNLANILTNSGMTCFVITHVYDNVGGYGDPLKIAGGRRIYYNATACAMTSTSTKDTDGDDVEGRILGVTSHKGTKAIPLFKLKYRLNFRNGLDPWYGLLDDALEGGFVEREGDYLVRPTIDDVKFKEKNCYCDEFWIPIFKKTLFEGYLNKKYCVESDEPYTEKDDVTELLYGKDA
jgi:recombination protein RecA